MNNVDTFAVILLPCEHDLHLLNKLRSQLYSSEFNTVPRNQISDAHITLGIGKYDNENFEKVKSQLEKNLQHGSFYLEKPKIKVHKTNLKVEPYLWVGVSYDNKNLSDLTSLVSKLLSNSKVNITDSYDDTLKSYYEENNGNKSLIGEHISLGNRCLISKETEIKQLLANKYPENILIDRIALKPYPNQKMYLWDYSLK